MNIPRMSYPQYRKARRLTHECCNYCNGNCLLLDDGEECVCVQSISYSLLCRWFKVAVLPLDAALCAEITKSRDEIKRCAVCGAAFTPNSNRAKYCPDCAVQVRRKKEAERQRKRYLLSTHLGRSKSTEIKGFSAWSAGRWIKLSCSPQNGVLNAGKWTKKEVPDAEALTAPAPGVFS